ncbi:MAG: hypothetical protein MUC52_01455 [Candidatus Omnitrophica bacterium]|jgi:hypothetical protein|nr:hypothetical protein [Candidatus Omnitrophota bacterium]
MKKIAHIVLLSILMSCNILCADVKLYANQQYGMPVFKYATPQTWEYLRSGLNYLESPHPLSRPESVSSGYMHPDGKGFGPLGFSPGAYEDVQRVYPYFRQYSWEDVISSSFVYDLANRAYADWLLCNLQDSIPQSPAAWQIFDVVHKAWNLGLTGYRKGKNVASSRIKRAEEFINGIAL